MDEYNEEKKPEAVKGFNAEILSASIKRIISRGTVAARESRFLS